ncbi:MAG: hypothetical protein ACREBR_00295, partial [bacterium]
MAKFFVFWIIPFALLAVAAPALTNSLLCSSPVNSSWKQRHETVLFSEKKSRRELLHSIGSSVIGLAGIASMRVPLSGALDDGSSMTIASNNPALETFKSRKGRGPSFIPGKGMRNRENVYPLLTTNNPALETFKSRKGRGSSFIPGRGMRNQESFDQLMTANNPALETFKSRKGKGSSFIPGRGMRNRGLPD